MASLALLNLDELGLRDRSDAASAQASLLSAGDSGTTLSRERLRLGPLQGGDSSVSAEQNSEINSTAPPLQTIQHSVPVFRLPRTSTRRSVSLSTERWEGTVLDVGEDAFRARLVDLDQSTADEEAEIFLSEVSDEDLPLLKRGALFYWSIGYHTDRRGQRTKSSLIRFRRLPTWTKADLKEAERAAEMTSSVLRWGSDSSDTAATRRN